MPINLRLFGLSYSVLLSFLLSWHSALAFEPLNIQGLLDIRASYSEDVEQSWLNKGLGPFRVDDQSEEFSIGQLLARTSWQVSDSYRLVGIVSAYDDATDNNRGDTFGINEFFLQYRPAPKGPFRVQAKLGAFFPDISLENTQRGWTSTLSLSNSAINTWLGEELRITGAHVSATHLGKAIQSEWDVGFSGTVFGRNDPIGAMLTWRGWSMHDRQLRLNEKIAIAPLPSIGEVGGFVKQSTDYDPFVEVDDRPGYAFSIFAKKKRGPRINVYYYDNRADPTTIRQGQYGWRTKFLHAGVWLPLRDSTRVFLQAIDGATLMGSEGDIFVSADYRAWYLAFSERIARARITLRYDKFRVRDLDNMSFDNNAQDGSAWLLALRYELNASLALIGEYVKFKETNQARSYFSLDERSDYSLVQVALQWRF